MGGLAGGVAIVALAALVYHYRIAVVTRVIPKIYEPSSKGNVLGAEFQAIAWANYLQTAGSVGAACCLPTDPQLLYDNFCAEPLGIVDHAIPLLSACTFYVRGRMEHPMNDFIEHGYAGDLKHRGYGHYQVRSWGPAKEDDEECDASNTSEVCKREKEKTEVPSQEFACSILKSCAKEKTKASCKEVAKYMGGC